MDVISVISVRLDPEQDDLQKTIHEIQKAVDQDVKTWLSRLNKKVLSKH